MSQLGLEIVAFDPIGDPRSEDFLRILSAAGSVDGNEREPKYWYEPTVFEKTEPFLVQAGQKAVAAFVIDGNYARHENALWLNYLAVDNSSRSMGIGAQVIDFVTTEARRDGYESIAGITWKQRRRMEFYKKLGFNITYRKDDDDYVDLSKPV